MLVKVKGFTIIELAITMVVLGILAIAVVPRFADTSVFNRQFFVDDLLSSVRYAQQVAVASGCHIQVSLTSSTLTLNQRQNCTSGTFNVNVPSPGMNASSYVRNAPTGVTLSNSNFPIYFDTLGRAISSGTSNVTSGTITVGTHVIQVIGETGFSYASS